MLGLSTDRIKKIYKTNILKRYQWLCFYLQFPSSMKLNTTL